MLKSKFKFSIILFIFLSILSLFYSCKTFKINLEEKNFDKIFLPVFIVPNIDITKKNEIIGLSLFFHKDLEDEKIIEYTVLFKDEDHPNNFINFIYDIYRSFKYKRIIDTESFFIRYIKSPDNLWIIDYVDFPDDFGANQVYFEKNVKHFASKIEGNLFEKKDNRVVIYCNTWNHMFSNKDTNLNLEKSIVADYKTYLGNRKTVEKIFNKKAK